jgi:hypothetical protein
VLYFVCRDGCLGSGNMGKKRTKANIDSGMSRLDLRGIRWVITARTCIGDWLKVLCSLTR